MCLKITYVILDPETLFRIVHLKIFRINFSFLSDQNHSSYLFEEYLTKVSEVFTYQQVHNSIIFEKRKKVSTMKLIYETIFVKFSWPIKVR